MITLYLPSTSVRHRTRRCWWVGLLIALSATAYPPALAQPISLRQLDRLVERNRSLFQVPGIAVAIIQDGKLRVCKGYGLRSLRTRQPVTPQTLFGIASNSKAFTAAAIGLLVDEGKLHWDDPVIKYLPSFRLYDSLAASLLTIRDLLSHRSGLPTAAGDLMHDPDSTNFTLTDILFNQRFIKPASSFRSQFAYTNNGYLVVGAIVAQVSGMSWEDFVEARILRPLGMIHSAASFQGCAHSPHIIDAHKRIGPSVRVVARYGSPKNDAAGGVYTSVAELSRWALVFLNRGQYGPALSKRLLSDSVMAELVAPQTIIPVHQPGSYRTHFAAYGLGWFLSDVKGYKEIAHSGQDVGMVSSINLLPELGLGVLVLTNSESGAASAIGDQIVDSYLGIEGQDRTKALYQREQAALVVTQTGLDSIQQQLGQQPALTKVELDSYVGVYQDRWFGRVRISVRDHQLWFAAERSGQLRGYLHRFSATQFVVRWANPELDSGALVTFIASLGSTKRRFVLEELSSPRSGVYADLQFDQVEP